LTTNSRPPTLEGQQQLLVSVAAALHKTASKCVFANNNPISRFPEKVSKLVRFVVALDPPPHLPTRKVPHVPTQHTVQASSRVVRPERSRDSVSFLLVVLRADLLALVRQIKHHHCQRRPSCSRDDARVAPKVVQLTYTCVLFRGVEDCLVEFCNTSPNPDREFKRKRHRKTVSFFSVSF